MLNLVISQKEAQSDLLFLQAYVTETTEVWEKCQGTMPARKKNGVKREEKKPMK